jgi:GTP pyrophosphokinase
MIRKAFDVSVEAHKDQRRKSGEAYIFHPLPWQNLSLLKLVGLEHLSPLRVHDVVEDTPTTVKT